MKIQEFWSVRVGNKEFEGEGGTVYVIANSAAEAEKAALSVFYDKMKEENGVIQGRFYVRTADKVGEIYLPS